MLTTSMMRPTPKQPGRLATYERAPCARRGMRMGRFAISTSIESRTVSARARSSGETLSRTHATATVESRVALSIGAAVAVDALKAVDEVDAVAAVSTAVVV